jgi:predicted ATPase
MCHPFSQAIALDYAAMLHTFRGESRAALERGQEAVELCSRHGFSYYLAMANVLTGWARAAESDVAAGLAQLREGLEALRALRAEIRLPYYCALLAETFGRAGEESGHVVTGSYYRISRSVPGHRDRTPGCGVRRSKESL